jgi:hypothetical protein
MQHKANRKVLFAANPEAETAWKLKNNKANEANARRKNIYANQKVIFDADPAAKTARKLKLDEAAARSRQKKKTRLEANPDEKEAERKKVAEQSERYKTKRLASFVADPAKKTAYILKNRDSAKRNRLKMKMEKKELEDAAEILMSLRGRNADPLADEKNKDGENDTEMIEDTNEVDDGKIEVMAKEDIKEMKEKD